MLSRVRFNDKLRGWFRAYVFSSNHVVLVNGTWFRAYVFSSNLAVFFLWHKVLVGSFNDYGHMVVLGLQSDFFRFGGLTSSVCGGCNYSGNTFIYNLCSIKVILHVFLDLASDLLHCKQESFCSGTLVF